MSNITVIIHTDGSAAPNPGPGGWAAILRFGEHYKEFSGSYRFTTNNRMELLSVIEAIKKIKNKGVNLEIYSDSSYVVNAINKRWLDTWYKDNFKGRVNADLWKEYISLRDDFNIQMIWVKGHANNVGNNRCDELATAASNQSNKENWLVDFGYEQSKT